jgi:hypothetical protein
MIFLTNVLAYGSRIFSSVLPFIQKYWKQILYIIPLVWTMFCILKHCNAPISVPVPGQRDTIVRFIYPDTNAIIKLLGYDTEPKNILMSRSNGNSSDPQLPSFLLLLIMAIALLLYGSC